MAVSLQVTSALRDQWCQGDCHLHLSPRWCRIPCLFEALCEKHEIRNLNSDEIKVTTYCRFHLMLTTASWLP